MLTKGELLNRMEILYPHDACLADLRRAYIDHDLGSIFRLMSAYHNVDAVAFEDLRKFLLADNTWSMYRLILGLHDNQLIRTIKSCHSSSILFDNDSLSQGQLNSKMWLINELKTLDINLGTVFLCAGWYGILSMLMFEHNIKMDKVRSFDIDPTVAEIADKFNSPWVKSDWRFKAITDDIHHVNFNQHEWTAWSSANERDSKPIIDTPNTIINTSCEHISNFDTWYAKIPAGKIVILQSNDYTDIAEHVNCVNSKEEFNDQVPMSPGLYLGELPTDKYNRYMKIGIK
jgi:hypothetical protein